MNRAVPRLLFLAAATIPAPAAANDAVLVLVDRSASMAGGNKWTFASQGIVQALDQDAFDTADVGLISAPSGDVAGPACVFGLPVPCAAPSLPQEAIGPAGPKSSLGPGMRQAIRDWMINNPPSAAGDGFPLYVALQSAINALRAWSGTGHRILIVVTDGGISCGQVSPRAGYGDCNGCDHEWENPLNMVALASQAKADASQPIDTFVIGVPGADTYDATACNAPPYHMRLALSAIAAAGAPQHVPGNCSGRTFTQVGGDPPIACHTDLTQAFTATAVANAISKAHDLVDDLIFGDGFESGDALAWSSRVTGGGDLSVSPAAALASSTSGLQGLVNDTAALYVQDDRPAAEGQYRARFYFNPNGFDPGEAQVHRRTRLFIAFADGPRRVVAIVLRRISGQYSVMGRARLDDNTQHDTGFFPITNAAHLVELRLARSTGPDANDGTFELWIDGASVHAATGLDNSASGVDFARLGALSVKTGASGTLLWDEFVSRRTIYIGP